jgi:hypothetical protein
MILRIVAFLLVLSAVPPAYAADIDNQSLANIEFAKGKRAYEAKEYKEAQPILAKAAALGSRDATIQYYLALAALQNTDYETFKRALARIIFFRHPKRTNLHFARFTTEHRRSEDSAPRVVIQ